MKKIMYSHNDIISETEENEVYYYNDSNKIVYVSKINGKINLITLDSFDKYGNFTKEEVLYKK